MTYWGSRWVEGRTGWHKNEPNSLLTKYISHIGIFPPKRILVPLCGKTLDLLWLYEKGFEVVGVELVEMPVSEFFKEHSIDFSVQQLSWGKVYQTEDHRLKIYVSDIFDAPPDELGKFQVIFDRASLVALEIKDRERYIELMKSVVDDEFWYFLVTLQFDGIDVKGESPRCIPHTLIEKLYGDFCTIELLEKNLEGQDLAKRFGYDEIWESIHLLTSKKTG